ncbi:GT2 family glycosyltransferase [Bradyrhizobium sp. USDA 4474]
MEYSDAVEGLPLGPGVKHVAVRSPADIAGSKPEEGMTVFWYGDRPIGHVIVYNGERTNSNIDHIDFGFLSAIEAEAQKKHVRALSASVVVCTRDRPAELQTCLSTLPMQSCPPREVIVVDNASRDQRTRDVALAAGVIYIREDRPGLDIARNTGAKRATSEIVAYTDDDVIHHPRWLEQLVGAFDTPEVAAVTGLVLPAELATEAQRHFETYWSFIKGYQNKDFDRQLFVTYRRRVFPSWDVGAGASMAFRRDIFDSVGLFDERLDVGQAGCSGDSEYWYRLLANGYTCRYAPASIAFHFHRRTIEGLASQIYHYMRGHSAALMVQYEYTGNRTNRLQAYYYTPRWYAARLLSKLLRPNKPGNRFLKEELLGYLAGLRFYNERRRRK